MSSLSQSLFHFSFCAWYSGYRQLPKVMTLATFGGRCSNFEWLKCVPYMGRAVRSYANIFPTKCENIHNFYLEKIVICYFFKYQFERISLRIWYTYSSSQFRLISVILNLIKNYWIRSLKVF